MSHMVYSNLAVTSVDGEVNIGHHTDAIYFLNMNLNDHVTIELNGGPHRIILRKHDKSHDYSEFIGDYKTFKVITASATVAVYAIG